MNNLEFVEKLKNVEANYKTLYVMGCFGAPLTASNKTRYCNNHSYNKKPARTKMIQAASASTFGFDCVCLIKAILWGWTGNKNRTYGGATYASNGVPDIGADRMISKCSNISYDFNNIEIGEAVWLPGHIGVYIGDGLVIESSPAWANGVQITACNRSKEGYNRRDWTKHGKLPYIEYVESEVKTTSSTYSFEAFVKDVQKACGATVDGIPGPETLSKTVTVSAKKNTKHAVVKALQKRFKAMGYSEIGTADGIAGPKFTSAVAHFQQDNGCVVDGEITAGAKTWQKLLKLA